MGFFIGFFTNFFWTKDIKEKKLNMYIESFKSQEYKT